MRPSQIPRHVESIVEEQVRRWELQRQAQRQREEKPPEPQPVVTVSREFGSRGAEVGALVAKKLGFSYWNQELVHEIAQRTGVREALVASLDEHIRSRLDEFIAHLFTGAEGTAHEYVRQVGHVVHTLERHGSAVIIGRGAQFVVRSDQALRMRVVCDHALRVKGYAERRGLSESEARRRVDETDRERRAFYRKHYDQDVELPVHYDLILNSGTLDLEAACEVATAAYRQKFPERTAQTSAR
jgi:cytidylate kinase